MTANSALRKSAGVVSVIAVLNAVVVASAASGAPRATLHLPGPLHLVSRATGSVTMSPGHFADPTTLASPSTGRTIGSGVLDCVNTSDRAVQRCTSAFALKDGILVAKETINFRNGTLNGTVMSGTGQYEGISGTITGKARPDNSVNITVNYSVN